MEYILILYIVPRYTAISMHTHIYIYIRPSKLEFYVFPYSNDQRNFINFINYFMNSMLKLYNFFLFFKFSTRNHLPILLLLPSNLNFKIFVFLYPL